MRGSMKTMATIFGIVCMVMVQMVSAQLVSRLVQVDAEGRITGYSPCPRGWIIPDFSHAGYMGGNRDIPVIDTAAWRGRIRVVPAPVADETVNRTNIQNAINTVGALPLQADGFRGMVVIPAGRYNINGDLTVPFSGVVIRGAGRGPDRFTSELTATDLQTMTMIYRTGVGTARACDVITLGRRSGASTWGSSDGGPRINITTPVVRPHENSFEVASTAGLTVGQPVVIRYPTTTALLESIWYGGNSNWTIRGSLTDRWTMTTINISFHRYIRAINGNRITVDAPVFYTLDRSISQAYVTALTTAQINAIFTNVGLENLRVSMDRTPGDAGSGTPDQNAVRLHSVENGWVRNLHVSDFIRAGVVTEVTTRSTIDNVRSVDASGHFTGANQYNINNIGRSQLILIRDCLMRFGRHHWISNGGSTVSGIVILRGRSTNSYGAAEGHRYFSQGILMDNWEEVNWTATPLPHYPHLSNPGPSGHRVGFFLRDNMGTMHGWGAVGSVLWNCNIRHGQLRHDDIFFNDGSGRTEAGRNFAIGTQLGAIRQGNTDSRYRLGYTEHERRVTASTATAGPQNMRPMSLYEGQLAARLGGGSNPVVSVTGVTLAPTTLNLTGGTESTLTATVAPANATNRSVTWTSSNTSVATVSSAGVVRGVAAGTATITVTTIDGGFSRTCAVTVTAPTVAVTGVTLNRTTMPLTTGASEGLTATVVPENATNRTVTWSSSAPAVATVNASGLVTAVSPGSATITVTTADGNRTATCAVTVTAPTVPVTGVTLNRTAMSIEVGEEGGLVATVLPANATNRAVTWTSSAPGVARVEGGVVVGVAAGSATITVRTADGGFTATCAVTVTPIAVTGVTLNKNWAAIMAGNSEQLRAVVAPTTAANRAVTWTSSNPAIATVSTDGIVTAVAPGTATITVTTADAGLTATAEIIVGEATAANAIRVAYATTVAHPSVQHGGGGSDVVRSIDGNVPYIQQTSSPVGSWFSIDIPVTIAGEYRVDFIYKTGASRATVQAYMNDAVIGNPIVMSCIESALNVSVLIGATRARDVHYYQIPVANVTLREGVNTFRTEVLTNGGQWTHLPVQVIVTPLFDPNAVTGVTLNRSEATIVRGSNETLTATVLPANATNRAVTWSSSNPSVATVSDAGVVTAVSAGTTTIIARTVSGGFTATCDVTVTVPVIDIPGTFNAGQFSSKSDNILYHDNANGQYVGNLISGSFLEYVLNVTETGIYRVSANVSVGAAHLPRTITLHDDDSDVLGTLTTLAGGGNWFNFQPITTNIVLERGVMTLRIVASGSVNIEDITIERVAITGISLDRATLSLMIEEEETLIAVVAPVNATSMVIWESSDSSVAIVDFDGRVTAVGAGTATITARTIGADFSATCLVTVGGGAISIHDRPVDRKHGIFIEENPVSEVASIRVITPEKSDVKLAIYDNAGNLVFASTGSAAGAVTELVEVWNLQNRNGRRVANGTYLVIAEAKGKSGKVYGYKAKLGVNRR